eukprot:scaffold287298_cov20-Prasinocladus_malaysianus.AAC.1
MAKGVCVLSPAAGGMVAASWDLHIPGPILEHATVQPLLLHQGMAWHGMAWPTNVLNVTSFIDMHPFGRLSSDYLYILM